MKGYFVLFAILFVSVISFSIWNFNQVDEVTIKVRDKYIVTEPGSKNHSGSVNYRVIDDNTGEYFDCEAYSWNPTATERIWNSLEKGKIYLVEARGLKNDYNIRTITEVK
jgi:hypothetical protein